MNMRSSFFPRRLSAWALSVAMAAAVCTADADVLYTQPPIDGGNAQFAESITPQQVADDFILGGAVNLEGITWWGSYYNNDDLGDDFVVRLYSGITGTGTILQDFGSVFVAKNTATPALTDSIGDIVYQYDFSLAAPLSLSGGTYYLSVQNVNNNSYWLWLTGTSGNGQFWSRGEDADPWATQSIQEDLAFSLNGTRVQVVPEPAPLALLLLAGAALLVARRRG